MKRDMMSSAHQSRQRNQRRGFALLMTLLLVMIVALLTLEASRISLRRAGDAMQDRRAVQTRWATLSLQQSLLPRAEQLLAAVEVTSREPVVCVRRTLRLGDDNFELLVSDEQAKVNPRALLEQRGCEDATQRLQRLLGDLVPAGRVILKPLAFSSATLASIGSYPQIVEGVGIREVVGDRSGQGISQRITCWGDGRINVMRAEQRSLEVVLTPDLDPSRVYQLIQLRASVPQPSLAFLLDQLDLTRDQRERVDQRVTGGSQAYSLWIIRRGIAPVYRLAVWSDRGNNSVGVECFEW